MLGFGLSCGAVVSANLWSEMRSTSLCFEILSRLCSEHRPQIDDIEPGSAGSGSVRARNIDPGEGMAPMHVIQK